MELVEPIELINESLLREFGKHEDGRCRFRVVFSEDMLEKRFFTHTKEGLLLARPAVEERKKYQNIKERYVLEQLSIVPEGTETDLLEKTSYEPLWTFEDRHGNYLPPRFDMSKLIIDQIYINMHKPPIKRTEDPDKDAKELQKVEEYLFGDETKISDALGLGLAVTVPGDINTEETITQE